MNVCVHACVSFLIDLRTIGLVENYKITQNNNSLIENICLVSAAGV